MDAMTELQQLSLQEKNAAEVSLSEQSPLPPLQDHDGAPPGRVDQVVGQQVAGATEPPSTDVSRAAARRARDVERT